MKFIPLIVPVLCIGLTTASCGKGKVFGIKGKGTNVKQSRSLSNFDQLELSIDADVYYVQDSEYSVEISAQSNVLSYLKTEVKDNELEIEFERNVFSHSKITITVHAPNIREFEINGSGRIEAQQAVTAGSLKLEVNGSGDMVFNGLTASFLEAEIEGSGNVKISSGTVDHEKLRISGSGNIDIPGITAKNASAHISGSGDITLRATDYLDANISGSGNIRYYGNPAMNVNVSGSGKIIHL